MSVFAEFSRRHVPRVALAYLAVSWLLIQVATSIDEPLGLPEVFATTVIIVLGIGFPVAVVFAWVFEITPDGIRRTTDVESEPGRGRVTGQRLNYTIIGALLLTIVLLITNDIRRPDVADEAAAAESGSAPIEDPSDSAASVTDERVSIAVLSFDSTGVDPDQQAFADGLTEEFRDTLGRLDNLRVIDWNSSGALEDRALMSREIGEQLGVEYLLGGSIEISGDSVRMRAFLSRASDSTQIWSDTLTQELADSFVLQAEMAAAVAEQLQIRLGVGDIGTRPGMTRNVEAYRLYLQATANWPSLSTDAAGAATRAIRLLDRAISIDEDFAIAWRGKAITYLVAMPFMSFDSAEQRDEWLSQSEAALERALELAPDSGEILAYAIVLAQRQGEWFEARRLVSGINPDISYGRFESELQAAYGSFLLASGSPEEAIRAFDRALTLDPLNGVRALQLGDAYLVAGDWEAALDAYDDGLAADLGAGDMLRGSGLLAAVASGDAAEISHWLDLIVRANTEAQADQSASQDQLEQDPITAFTVAMIELADNREAATAEVRRYVAEQEAPSIIGLGIWAGWAASHGDTEYALELLRRIPLPAGTQSLTNVIWRPAMAEIRSRPEFRELMREVGLVEYWREFGWPEMCEPDPFGDEFVCR